jgi:hypothetical protein
MKRLIAFTGSALMLLGSSLALAQEEAPAEEAPAEEAAPAEEVPAEAAPAEGEAAPAEETAAAEEAPAGEAGEESAEESQWEGEYSGFVEAYYVPTAEFGAAGVPEAYADGAGGRGQFQFWKFLAVSAEYTTRTFDDDTKLDEQRVGLGAAVRNGSGDTAGLFIEMERLEPEGGEVIDGYGLHGRMSHPATEWFRFNADLGYKRLEDDVEKYSGFEFSAGGIVTFGNFGVFAEWRRSQLDGKDSGARLHLEEVRTGLRYDWGGADPG